MKMEPPPELAALLAVYVEITGLAVTLSYERARALTELHSRGMTPEDVRAVVGHLKHLVKSGAKGYTESSLEFRNAMGNADTFEERALRLRQRRQRLKGTALKGDVPHTRTLPDGSTTTVLAPAVPTREVPALNIPERLKELADSLKGGPR